MLKKKEENKATRGLKLPPRCSRHSTFRKFTEPSLVAAARNFEITYWFNLQAEKRPQIQRIEHQARSLKLIGLNIHNIVFYFIIYILFTHILNTQII
jgi:hypothetical protein